MKGQEKKKIRWSDVWASCVGGGKWTYKKKGGTGDGFFRVEIGQGEGFFQKVITGGGKRGLASWGDSRKKGGSVGVFLLTKK